MRKKEFIPMNLQLFAEPPAGGDGDAGDTSATGGKSGEGSNKADPDDEGDDGVSLAEQVAQLKVQNAKLKKANDKATSEAASYKKQLREKQTGQKIFTTDVLVELQEFAESKAASAQNGNQNASAPTRPNVAQNDSDGFMNIPDAIEEELPFATN